MADGSSNMPGQDHANAKILKSVDYAALERAQRSIASAEQEADTILANARAEAEAIVEHARQQGREDAARLVGEYLAGMQQEIAGRPARLTDLVSAALHRVIEPVPAEETIAATVQKVLSETDFGTGAYLTVTPSLVRTLKEHFAGRGISPEILDVRGDPDCVPGSSVLHCEFGDIELGIEEQIAALEQGMRQAQGGPQE